jgi:RNA polymerase sigma-70 factor (ECF subfamily)
MRSETSRRRREENEARQTAEAGDDLDRQVWDMALAGHVRDAMTTLHPTERKAVHLAYFGGRTYREVAVELGEAEGTVKSRIRSGLKRLRAELAAAGVAVADV